MLGVLPVPLARACSKMDPVTCSLKHASYRIGDECTTEQMRVGDGMAVARFTPIKRTILNAWIRIDRARILTHTGFYSERFNLSPFTKDYRG